MDSKVPSTKLGEPLSSSSSATHVSVSEKEVYDVPHGHGESALPGDKLEEAKENSIDDWEEDSENPRNWSFGKKWTAVGIVSFLVLGLVDRLITLTTHRSHCTHSSRL
jgi:hypothetical protein